MSAWIFAVLFQLFAGLLAAGDTTASDLRSMAPIVSSRDPKCRSIEVHGYLRDPSLGMLRFRVIYRAPDRFAMLLSDPSDGTPLIFATDGQLLVYDPTRSVIHLDRRETIQFRLKLEQEKLSFKYEWRRGDPARNEFLFDLKSIFGEEWDGEMVAKAGDRFTLTKTDGMSGSCTAEIVASRACPYTRIEIRGRGQALPAICLDKIEVNQPISEDEFLFPAPGDLPDRLTVVEHDKPDAPPLAVDNSVLLKAIRVRTAANHPELRGTPGVPGAAELDWDHVLEVDRLTSKALKGLVRMKPAGAISP